MNVFFVSNQNQKITLLSEQTNYLLPFSGKILIKDIVSSLIYINGDAYPVEKTSKMIDVASKSMDIDVDGIVYTIRVLCGECSNEIKFDYSVFGNAFHNNLIDNKMDEEILWDALKQETDELRLSLCTFNRKFDSITKDIDIDSMAECVDKFPHIFQKPKQHLKQVNEVRPAAIVSRIGQESISHLASHSEHWKGLKVNGLVPERLLARTLEDDYAIYENRVVKTLVDKLYKELKSIKEENMDCSMQMDIDDGHSLSSEQKNYYHARDILMRGMDDDSIVLNQMLLEEQRIAIDKILNRLSKCKSTPLYRLLKKQKTVIGKLKKTNIFMMDKYYKEAYRLWELMSQKKEYYVYDEVKDIDREYEIFCKVLFLFALKYFHYEGRVQRADIFKEDKLLSNEYYFKYWNLEVGECYLEELDVNAFEITLWKEIPISIDVTDYDISSDISLNVDKIHFHGNRLTFYKKFTEPEQDDLLKKIRGNWPQNKQKRYSSELKQKMYAAFSNYQKNEARVLMIPWKYPIPDNVEEATQVIEQLKEKVSFRTYDKIVFLTISRPNEYVNIKEETVLNQMLNYGWANANVSCESSKFACIPIGTGDINSYRRYTKILLDQMIQVDSTHDICPICGDNMKKGAGNNNNVSTCTSCGFQLIETQCSACGEKYMFSRYDLPKVSEPESDMPGFKIMSGENILGFKNITNVYVEENQIIPICPCCGH